MKLTEKMKKNLAILGGVLIGIGLIAAIGMQFGPKPSGEDVLPGTGETETELIVDPGDFEKKEESGRQTEQEPPVNNGICLKPLRMGWIYRGVLGNDLDFERIV